jgi:hypothetical protein
MGETDKVEIGQPLADAHHVLNELTQDVDMSIDK